MVNSNKAQSFFESFAENVEAAAPLRWSSLLDGLSLDQVKTSMDEISEQGFTEAEALCDEEWDGQFYLWFAEVRVHSSQPWAKQVVFVEEVCDHEGLVTSDFSAESTDV